MCSVPNASYIGALKFLIHCTWLTTIDNYVDGKEFVRLSKKDIEKMIPPVGMANKIMRLQEKVTTKSVRR